MGDVAKQDFLAFYVQDRQAKAAAGMNYDPDMIYTETLLAANKMSAPTDISADTKWQQLATHKLQKRCGCLICAGYAIIGSYLFIRRAKSDM